MKGSDIAIRRSQARKPNLRVAGFVHRHGELLLVRQEKADRTYWLLPGGGVERGELLTEALARELFEECGLRADPLEPPLGLVESVSPDQGRTRHVIHLIYAVLPESGALCAPTDPAIKEARWFAEQELRGLVIHPPIYDLLSFWLDLFGAGRPDPWPHFLSAGRRWAD